MTESLRTPVATPEGLRSASTTAAKESLRSDAPPPEWETLLGAAASQFLTRNPAPAGCTAPGRQAVPGLAVPGCMVPGLDLGYR